MSAASQSAVSAKAARALTRRSPWFGSVFLKSLRDYRVAILGWGLGLGATIALYLPIVASVASTPEGRQSLSGTAGVFNFFWEAVDAGSPAGYLLFKFGALLAFPAIWGLLVGSRTLRGEEERGSLDVLLSAPRSRTRVAFEKLAALGVACLVIGLLIGALTGVGGILANASFGNVNFTFGDAMLLGLDVSLVTAAFAAIALFVSQFTRERGTAAGLTGAFFGLSFLLNTIHLVFPSAENLSRISPIYYFALSKPIIPSYGANPGAMLVLAGIAVVFSLAGVALFLSRDVGASIRLFPAARRRSTASARRLPTHDWTLRSIFARSLSKLALSTIWWGLGIGFVAAILTLLARQTEKNLAGLIQGSSGSLQGAFNALTGGGDIATNAGFLSIIFAELPLVFTIYALIQATNWSNDEEDGRFELVLATPQSRLRLMLMRYAAFVTSLLTITTVLLVAVVAAAATQDLALDGGRVVEAVVGILPIALVVSSIGYLLAGWVRANAVMGILGAFIAGSFVLDLLAAILNWPVWTQKLSIYSLYGAPLITGLDWGAMVALLAVAVVALALGTWRFAGKDVGR